MIPDTPRQRRDGWPWPATIDDHEALRETEARVQVAALAVAEITVALNLALQRLEEAQDEVRVAGECVAVREAAGAIARARRHDD